MNRIACAVLLCTSMLAGCKKKEDKVSQPPGSLGVPADAAAGSYAADAMAAMAADAAIANAAKRATATLEPRSKSKAKGTVAFEEIEGGVQVVAKLEGLTPGDHAFHVHEKGDCSAPDAASAGGHFDPTKQPHGAPEADARHAGDFGNLTADKDGKAEKTVVMKGITIAEGPTSIVGKGFIVHEKADDFKTQPTGNAGGRVACGVIELAK
jgi:superoxide dismutase, Cu-Zn family